MTTEKNKVKENTETTVTETPARSERLDFLSSFIDSTINKDDAGIESSWSKYVTLKSREILHPVAEHAQPKDVEEDKDDEDEKPESKYAHLLKNRDKKKAPLKKMKKSKVDEVNEAVLREFTGENSPIRLKGDDVFVKGKLVGHIVNDLNDLDSGIVFQSADGKFKKEFDTIRDVYSFLLKHFNIQSEKPLDVDEE